MKTVCPINPNSYHNCNIWPNNRNVTFTQYRVSARLKGNLLISDDNKCKCSRPLVVSNRGSWRGSCDLTHHYRLQAQRLEHAMIPPISVFRGNPDRTSAGGWAATPRRLISVAAAASVLSELGNVFQWRRRMEAGHGGLLLMEDVSVCLTRLQYQFKSLTGFTAGGTHLLFILLAEVCLLWKCCSFPNSLYRRPITKQDSGCMCNSVLISLI